MSRSLLRRWGAEGSPVSAVIVLAQAAGCSDVPIAADRQRGFAQQVHVSSAQSELVQTLSK